MFLGLGLTDNLTGGVASPVGIGCGPIPNPAFKISYLLLNPSSLYSSSLYPLFITAVYTLFCLLYFKERYHFYCTAAVVQGNFNLAVFFDSEV